MPGAWQRYGSWVGGLLHGDFGLSYTYRIPVGALLAERLQVSLPLAVYALLLSTALAFPSALYAAARRGRLGDSIVSGITQLGLAVPNFWLGMLLVLVFAIALRWVSAGGFPGWEAGFWPAMKALTLPAIALAMPQAAILARVLRGALIDTLHEDYIRSARAKGVGERRVLLKHALPNAMVPVLTILGMQFSFLARRRRDHRKRLLSAGTGPAGISSHRAARSDRGAERGRGAGVRRGDGDVSWSIWATC